MLELSPYDEDSNIKCPLTDLIFTNSKIIDKSKQGRSKLDNWGRGGGGGADIHIFGFHTINLF